MKWRGLLPLIIAIVRTVYSAEEMRCESWPDDRRVIVSALPGQGRCRNSARCNIVGAIVRLSCKKKWLLFGPRDDVTCTEDGWSTDISRAQCKRIRTRDILRIRSKTAPTVSLALSGKEIPSLTDSKGNLTSVNNWGEVGSKFTASCQTRWTIDTDITGVELPKLFIEWFKIAADGSEILVPQQQTSNMWSESSEAGDKSYLIVNEFQEKGNYTFKCIVTPWQLYPWSSLQATLEVQVTEPLCPPVEPPCNTHVIGQIREENRTENTTLQFLPDPGWALTDGRPLETKCINSDWEPPIGWLGVKRVMCPPVKLGVGISKHQLDGPWDNHFGSWYRLFCMDHLTVLNGFPRVYCNSSGMWDPDPTLTTCKKISCGEPPKVPFASCDCPDRNYSIESVCKCTCDSRYKGSNRQIECRSTGWWPPANSLPACIPCQHQCNLPRGWTLAVKPSSGVIKNRKKWAFCDGVVVQVACRKNLTVRGRLRCQGGEWDWIDHPECK